MGGIVRYAHPKFGRFEGSLGCGQVRSLWAHILACFGLFWAVLGRFGGFPGIYPWFWPFCRVFWLFFPVFGPKFELGLDRVFGLFSPNFGQFWVFSGLNYRF